jgi:hypothetical protein
MTPNGSSVPLTIAAPGQNARYTFTGTNGQRVSLDGTNATISGSLEFGCDVWVRMLKPDNNELAGSMTCMEGGAFMEPVTLPSTGPYTVLVDPVSAASGTLTLTLFDVPPDASGSLTVNGSEVPLALTGPGQKARLTFTIASTQQVTVRLTGNTIGQTTVTLLKPGGAIQDWSTASAAAFNLSTQTLSTTGTYTVVVDPSRINTGTISVALTSP